MTTAGLTPAEKVDKALGKAINHSSQGRECEARECLREASEAMPELPADVWQNMQTAQHYHAGSSEFRRYLREARQFLELEADR